MYARRFLTADGASKGAFTPFRHLAQQICSNGCRRAELALAFWPTDARQVLSFWPRSSPMRSPCHYVRSFLANDIVGPAAQTPSRRSLATMRVCGCCGWLVNQNSFFFFQKQIKQRWLVCLCACVCLCVCVCLVGVCVVSGKVFPSPFVYPLSSHGRMAWGGFSGLSARLPFIEGSCRLDQHARGRLEMFRIGWCNRRCTSASFGRDGTGQGIRGIRINDGGRKAALYHPHWIFSNYGPRMEIYRWHRHVVGHASRDAENDGKKSWKKCQKLRKMQRPRHSAMFQDRQPDQRCRRFHTLIFGSIGTGSKPHTKGTPNPEEECTVDQLIGVDAQLKSDVAPKLWTSGFGLLTMRNTGSSSMWADPQCRDRPPS